MLQTESEFAIHGSLLNKWATHIQKERNWTKEKGVGSRSRYEVDKYVHKVKQNKTTMEWFLN